jgi:vaccinia related kinase
VHALGYMHNDLKLENILIGHKDPNKIYLIDFGLAQKFLEEDGSHKKKEQLHYFSGNFMFASLNSCRGNSKSRRDDMESLFYLTAFLINEVRLPWSEFEGGIREMVNKRLS